MTHVPCNSLVTQSSAGFSQSCLTCCRQSSQEMSFLRLRRLTISTRKRRIGLMSLSWPDHCSQPSSLRDCFLAPTAVESQEWEVLHVATLEFRVQSLRWQFIAPSSQRWPERGNLPDGWFRMVPTWMCQLFVAGNSGVVQTASGLSIALAFAATSDLAGAFRKTAPSKVHRFGGGT